MLAVQHRQYYRRHQAQQQASKQHSHQPSINQFNLALLPSRANFKPTNMVSAAPQYSIKTNSESNTMRSVKRWFSGPHPLRNLGLPYDARGSSVVSTPAQSRNSSVASSKAPIPYGRSEAGRTPVQSRKSSAASSKAPIPYGRNEAGR